MITHRVPLGGGGNKVTCSANRVEYNNQCYDKTRSCTQLPANAKSGTQTFNNGAYGTCVISECNDGYELQNNNCVKQQSEQEACEEQGYSWDDGMEECYCASGDNDEAESAVWNKNTEQCECSAGYRQDSGWCYYVADEDECLSLEGSWTENDDGGMYCSF